ncbi:hypothetical protein ACO0K9_11780 [Undibacterium sp. Ji50W]|uniref:hypothetical protein n=1 Tax=Undibacterium sp. Ji50W TaxID=3413041 RepID=UPI003BF0D13D
MNKVIVDDMDEALTRTELRLIATFMDTASREFSQHGRNIFTLKATPENKEIALAAHAHHSAIPPGDYKELSTEDIVEATDEIIIFDDWLMAHFAHRCQKINDEIHPEPPFTKAEYAVLSELLELAYEEHEKYSDDVCYDLSLEPTEENILIMSKTVDLFNLEHVHYPKKYQQSVAKKLTELRVALASNAVINFPDYWIIHHFACECRKHSGNPEPIYDFNAPRTDELEWSPGYEPSKNQISTVDFCKEVRTLARLTFEDTRCVYNLAGDKYLSIGILTEDDTDRDILYHDKAFIESLELIRMKYETQDLELQCFAFFSTNAVNRGLLIWWFEGECPQIRYDNDDPSDLKKWARWGISPEILDLVSKNHEQSTQAEAYIGRGKSSTRIKAFFLKHWIAIAFVTFLLAILLFGKR